jgi:hypothetical protein
MNVGDLMTFWCPVKDRMNLPCFRREVIRRVIECSDQIDVLKVFPGDRVRIEELRDGYALVAHASCKDVVALVSTQLLAPIPPDAPREPHINLEDAAL